MNSISAPVTSKIDQKEYMKKYLSEPKKKKKKLKIKNKRVKIIDDDADVLVSHENLEIDFFTTEDAPQIAGIIDERPIELRVKDKEQIPNRWITISSDDDENTAISIKKEPQSSSDNENSTNKINDDMSPPRIKIERSCSDNDISPPRNNKGRSEHRKKLDDDVSPPRRRKDDSDVSPPRRRRNDSDASPPRKKQNKTRQKSPDSDISPPRSKKELSKNSRSRKDTSDNDISPPRYIRNKDSPPRKNHHEKNDFNMSKRRKQSRFSDVSPARIQIKQENELSQDSNDSQQKMKKTLDGKIAGLQKAKDLKDECRAFKKREDELFNKMSDDMKGVNAATIVRDRKTGRIRDFEKEAAEKKASQAEQNIQKQKYDRWGKGLKQVEDSEAKIQDYLHEISKPLARYADDEDLDKYLKSQEREGDPMLEYIRKENRKNNESVPDSKPRYNGAFMPNRFGIPPGYRWDGVDRSSGYEKDWFEVQNKKKALEEEAYKWSTEDM